MENPPNQKCVEALGRYASAIFDVLISRIQMQQASATGSLQGVAHEIVGRAAEDEMDAMEDMIERECGIEIEHDDMIRRRLYATNELAQQVSQLRDALEDEVRGSKGEGIVPLPETAEGDEEPVFKEKEPPDVDIMHG